ncbi:nicotinate phosphoribosyltransferase family protein [Burkholderia gladioli]|uniref:Nicotinamide phosphoribosyltransferase n=2 Tax=Burkholderia gladioli TaxID=28095 RepID=A0AAW3F2P9_BURGA|nr:nicotinate phosphoribosyltransferase [Burkholderia gladioli]AJW94955.1 nicotinate phosphoribosyltransferase family protein [Burkholderia gladioli]ASD84182.1 nicotinate phosphoribosyltransferase [Burkholderia gladioli pv. gladioli]AWY51603.1 nicotinate phosphoribosyltransferase [Burkholderia gladioli pv. gladioli]KGC15018.1 nicotinate phosphoribosyltransferase family protein [Burkholderia gladioli]SPU89002.1 putative nicotinate phosphoribosyltransferase [Burkholderia gladioli]
MHSTEAGGLAAILANPILNTDSYKASHYLQYPPDATAMFSYVESRGGRYERTLFFGLQMLLKEYLYRPVTHAMVDEARDFFALHGEPFNEAGWRRVVERYDGYLPVRIRAVPEGSVVPVGNALITVECTDPELFWLASHVETMLLRIWYPVTVATRSWHLRQTIRHWLERGDEDLSQLPFKLHDFGARGVSSAESAAIGGAAHLVSFMGSDTVLGVLAANRFYREPMAAYSVPAAEHSTITSWGRDGELEAYRHVLAHCAKPGGIVSVVSDSYDLFAALDLWGGPLRQQVIDSGATLVVRPDSGDPETIVLATVRALDAAFGASVNRKGRRVLNHVRVIQGDGVNEASIEAILASLDAAGYSAGNVVFGMGGALLQQVDRDTQRFAMKCSAIRRGEVWHPVGKDPVTDPGKRSKQGRLTLQRHRGTGAYRTVAMPAAWDDHAVEGEWEDALRTVFDTGRLLEEVTLAEVRARAHAHEAASEARQPEAEDVPVPLA